MYVTCGTDIELTCPIRSVKNSDQVVGLIQWIRRIVFNGHFLDYMVSTEFISFTFNIYRDW
jgi:hypothetical protein